jgi:diguanylate cyclase (GGDEF)-like protein
MTPLALAVDGGLLAEGHITKRRPRLLVVDDQPLNIQTLYQAFSADHQVLMATGGEQALALCASQQPDLVLLDVVMPGMDGYEVCRRLKADAATRDIPVIFVTAHSDEAAETLGLAAGAVDFISKPINPNIVRARVGTHLTLKAQSDLLRQWVYIDGLTGVLNRRHFDERLGSEWARSVRTARPLSVVLVDVDFFKRYNDCYGHQAGDDCLRRIAAVLRDGLRRPADMLARYGGEEFVCLLPETAADGAMTVARELERRVRAMGLPHARSDVAEVVTISLGVAGQTAAPGAAAAGLMAEADTRLYLAKSTGRGRAC